MTSVEITLPDSLFAALRKAPHEVPREMRIATESDGVGAAEAVSRGGAETRRESARPPRLRVSA